MNYEKGTKSTINIDKNTLDNYLEARSTHAFTTHQHGSDSVDLLTNNTCKMHFSYIVKSLLFLRLNIVKRFVIKTVFSEENYVPPTV